jgi:OOP family OmpA-OmpF porin
MLKTLLATSLAAFVLTACESQPVTAAAASKTPQQPRTFMLFFEFDRATLKLGALEIAKEAANAARASHSSLIICTGHTDSAGAAAYNMTLSLRRASAVKEALTRDGVPDQSIDVWGRGEDALLVRTRDGAREPQNRRVEILIQ